MCPDARMKEVDITLVNDDNAVECLDIWKNSSTFEFDHAFQVMLRDGIKVTPRAASKYNIPCMLTTTKLFCFCRHGGGDVRSFAEGADRCNQVV